MISFTIDFSAKEKCFFPVILQSDEVINLKPGTNIACKQHLRVHLDVLEPAAREHWNVRSCHQSRLFGVCTVAGVKMCSELKNLDFCKALLDVL